MATTLPSSSTSSSSNAKVTLNLPIELIEQLKNNSSGSTFTQQVRDALSLKLYLDAAIRDGAKVVLDRDGSLRELVIR